MAEERPMEASECVREVPTFDLTKKKKKKQQQPPPKPQDQADGYLDHLAEKIENFTTEEGGEDIVFRCPREKSNGDYTYEELLSRVFDILHENNPELTEDRRRTVMRPPQVLQEGTNKTVFVNFMDLCKTMHRQSEHVMTFLLTEIGTSGSLDRQQHLVVKGRFSPKDIEEVFHRYINKYVICNICRSPDTFLMKEKHLIYLRCEQCGSSRSVAPINANFVVGVGRRNMRT